jgi:hypothetical protein
MGKNMHVATEPAILYLGTPVVLISTVNDDGSYNLAPMPRRSGSAGAAFSGSRRIRRRR